MTDCKEIHRDNLQQLCRLCGAQGHKPKQQYEVELLRLFDIDLSTDDIDIHPSLLCQAHMQLLYRCRRRFGTGRSYKTDFKPVCFEPHSTSCPVCFAGPFQRDSRETYQVKSPAPTDKPSLVDDILSLSVHERTELYRQLLQSQSEANLLGSLLGEHMSPQIKTDADSFARQFKDIGYISEIDSDVWLESRNSTLMSFLSKITSQPDNRYLLARTVESIYKLSVPSLISPFAFLQNLSIYIATGSKYAVDILGHCSPSGGYHTITTWIADLKTAPAPVPSGVLCNVFDNEQVVGRKHQIKPNHATEVSVITTKGFVVLSGSDHQTRADLFPPSLRELSKSSTPAVDSSLGAALSRTLHQDSSNYEAVHMEQLNVFITAAIEEVLDDSVDDDIDKVIHTQTAPGILVCTLCSASNSRRKQICSGCGAREGLSQARRTDKELPDESVPPHETFVKVTFASGESQTEVSSQLTEERYAHIVSNHEGPKELILTDPVFCNPNCLETVAQVLRQIGRENGIARYGGKQRNWTFVCCDGLPFLICKKLSEEAVICNICFGSFLSTDAYKKHHRTDHRGRKSEFYHEFDWFYLKIGSGHYELNLIRAFFELNWLPFLEALSHDMGFKSELAKRFALSCKDLHKSWTLLLVFHVGALRELVRPYVRQSVTAGRPPTANQFLEWSNETYTDPTRKYLLSQVTRYSQGIINFRMAVRRNNADLLESAKFMTRELFFGRNHPKYQEIEVYDTVQKMMMPSEVLATFNANSSITTTGNCSLGEGFDFILEEKNRELKDWIPNCVPSSATWLHACRNQRRLSCLKQMISNLVGVPDRRHCVRPIDVEAAVFSWRARLRHYVAAAKSSHLSIRGEPLDDALHKFTVEAGKRRQYYIETACLRREEPNIPELRHPVPVSHEERLRFEDLSNMRRDDILRELDRNLSKLPQPLCDNFRKIVKELSRKGKPEVIRVHQMVSEALAELNRPTSDD